MNVLFVVWENDPFFKFGGLGDIARSLPGALKTMDVDIRVIIPYYKVVKMGRNKKTKVGEYSFLYAGKNTKVEVWQALNPYTKVIGYFLTIKLWIRVLARALAANRREFVDQKKLFFSLNFLSHGDFFVALYPF